MPGGCDGKGPGYVPPQQEEDAGAKKARPASAYRKVFNPKTWSEDFVETDEPEFYVRANE